MQRTLIVIGALLIAFGCKSVAPKATASQEDVETITENPPLAKRVAEKLPALSAFSFNKWTDEGTLQIRPVEMPVKIVSKKEGDSVTLALVADDETIETEKYVVDGGELGLAATPDEAFSPAIGLFSAKDGLKATSWKGKATFAGKTYSGVAEVSRKEEPASDTFGNEYAALKVDIKIQLQDGDKLGDKRLLTYWISPKNGVIKRSCQLASTRLPGGS